MVSTSVKNVPTRRKAGRGIALAAALVPLAAVAAPAMAVTQVNTSVSMSTNESTPTIYPDGPDAPNASIGVYENAYRMEGRAQATTAGQTFVSSYIFSEGQGQSGGVAATGLLDGFQRGVESQATWTTDLLEGNHKFIFYVATQHLEAALNDSDPSEATVSRTEMKVTLGEGVSEQVLYHWTAELVADNTGYDFNFNPIVAPGGTFLPIYQDNSSGPSAYYFADDFDAGLDLGFQAAGTKLTATYTTYTNSYDDSDLSYITAQARFGDPIDFQSPLPNVDGLPFEVITTTSAIPEPTSAMLLATGLGGLLFMRRRKA